MDEDNTIWGQLIGRDNSRKKPELVVSSDKKRYEAFETQDKLKGFLVHATSSRMSVTFFYHHLYTITLSTPDGGFLVVTTNTAIIRIYGRNLYPLSVSLGLHTCKAFTEYHPDWFLEPTDQSKPFISKIELKVVHGGGETRQGAETKKGEG